MKQWQFYRYVLNFGIKGRAKSPDQLHFHSTGNRKSRDPVEVYHRLILYTCNSIGLSKGYPANTT